MRLRQRSAAAANFSSTFCSADPPLPTPSLPVAGAVGTGVGAAPGVV